MALASASCANPFETDVANPNAVVEERLNDPTGSTPLVNGLGATVTRALTGIYGPYHTASDQLRWVGSREFWKLLDDGDISDPVNEYTDGAYPLVSEARWMADYTIPLVTEFEASTTGALQTVVRKNLARANIYGAVIYTTIGDMFEDFVVASNRTEGAASVGPANMGAMYDSAITMTTRALALATTTSDLELQRQALGLRARARHAKAVRAVTKAGIGAPINPLIDNAAANADATAALALMTTTYRFALTPVAQNLAGINVGFETNNRGELRAGDDYVNANPSRPIVPADGIAGIKMVDPVTNAPSTTVQRAIDACCRPAVGNNIPMTQVSAREMRLILAEANLAAGRDSLFLVYINESRAVDALPPYTAKVGNGRGQLEYERKVQLFLQGRRLMDLYRFGSADSRWLTSPTTGVRSKCLLPISYFERLTNPAAPQPTTVRTCS
jgi:hypothetical protein